MKYDTETTNKLAAMYKEMLDDERAEPIACLAQEFGVPERSIIAKLASMGLYKRKEYTDKQGNPPVKKEEYVERIAALLDKDIEVLESLEKVNKNVLKLLEQALSALK